MMRYGLVISFCFLLVCANAHAGIGGTWVMEWLLCMDTAESAGIPRDEARSQCSQGLLDQEGRASDPSWSSQANSEKGGTWLMEWLLCMDTAESAGILRSEKGGVWIMEWLLCMDTAESAGIPRDEARSQCSQGLLDQGSHASDP